MKAEAKSLAVRASSILIFALLVVGCTHYAVVDARLDSPPLVERLPLTVGVFFSPEFESYVHTAQIGEGPSVAIIPVGQPSIALFDQIFDSMFERSARVDSRGPLPHTAQNLDGVIEIALDSFVAGYGAGGRVTIKLQVSALYQYWEEVFDMCLSHIDKPDDLLRSLNFLEDQQHPDPTRRRDARKRRMQFFSDNKNSCDEQYKKTSNAMS